MGSLYEIPAAKALMGAAFIQYLIYAVFYILEGAKLEEYQNETISASKAKSSSSQQKRQQKEEQKSEQEDVEGNGQPVDLKEIALDDEDQTEDSKQQQQQQHEANEVNESIDQTNDYDFENAHFIVRMSKNYQKSTVWFMLVCGLATVRAAEGLTIALAYAHLLMRVIQMMGIILKKKRISQVAYILATICIVVMFFAVMVQGGDYASFF